MKEWTMMTTIIMIMTIAIADIDASFQKNKWDKEGGIKE